MARLLKGAPAAAALTERASARSAALAERGIVPTLAIVRVGERSDDLAYERASEKRCAAAGVAVRKVVLPAGCDQVELNAALKELVLAKLLNQIPGQVTAGESEQTAPEALPSKEAIPVPAGEE